jgi:hypothetical protein
MEHVMARVRSDRFWSIDDLTETQRKALMYPGITPIARRTKSWLYKNGLATPPQIGTHVELTEKGLLAQAGLREAERRERERDEARPKRVTSVYTVVVTAIVGKDDARNTGPFTRALQRVCGGLRETAPGLEVEKIEVKPVSSTSVTLSWAECQQREYKGRDAGARGAVLPLITDENAL